MLSMQEMHLAVEGLMVPIVISGGPVSFWQILNVSVPSTDEC